MKGLHIKSYSDSRLYFFVNFGYKRAQEYYKFV